MKFRTCLLAVCMVIVPTLAMFSHLIPVGTRRSVRDCVMTWLTARSRPTAVGPTSAARDPTEAVRAQTTVGGETGPEMAVTATPGDPTATSLPTGPDGGGQLPPFDESVRRLSGLGAVSIECVALPAAVGRHLASCQVPLDPEGQLHRVFQMEGSDAATATHLLLNDVMAWQRRLAEQRGIVR